jgi:Domain of unknown function (DUF1707)
MADNAASPAHPDNAAPPPREEEARPEPRPGAALPVPRPGAQPEGSVDPRRDLRASHEDRDRIVELLRVAAGDGRLSIDELDERVEAALTARTYGELEFLVTDLPVTPGAAAGVPAGVLAKKPKEVVRLDCGSGTVKRDGRWAVPQRMEVKVRSGVVILDFTQAQVTWPTLQIDAEVHSGVLLLLTKPGIVVDTDDVAVHSGAVKVEVPWGHDVPATLRIDVSGRAHSGTIVARPPRAPRRSFLDWLRRRPRPRQPWELLAGHQPYGLPPGQL